jgi:hypothetical protein
LDLAGTSTSGLEITYTSTTPSVCTVVGRRVTFVSIGKCSIKGAQAGGTPLHRQTPRHPSHS